MALSPATGAPVNGRLATLNEHLAAVLMSRSEHGGGPLLPPLATGAAVPAVTQTGGGTLSGQVIGPQTGQVTEVGSRGTWDTTFGRLSVSGKSGLDFYLDGQAVEIVAFPGFSGSAPYLLFVDGAPVNFPPSSLTFSASTSTYIKIAFTTSARRRIEFFCFISGAWYQLQCSATTIVTPAARKPVVGWVGDSFWGGSNGTEAMETSDVLISRALGWECFSVSFGGTGYCSSGSFVTFGDPTRVAAIAAANPEFIVFQGSVNDDAFTGPQIQAAAAQCYAVYQRALPNAKLIVFGPQPSNAAATLTNVRQASIAAVKAAALAAPNVIAFHDQVGTAGGIPPAAASFQTYPDGTLLTYLGSVWKVSNGGAAFTNGPHMPNADPHYSLQTYAYYGTGQVGGTTGDGNRDVLVYSDGVHPTQAGSFALAVRQLADIRADLIAYARL